MNRMKKTALIMPMISATIMVTVDSQAAQKRVAPAKSAPRPVAPTTATPFALRSVTLGITLDEFHAVTPINDDGWESVWSSCSNDPAPERRLSLSIIPGDAEDGIVTCQWFHKASAVLAPYPTAIALGMGKGIPIFDFLKDSSGTPRLFRIRFYDTDSDVGGITEAIAGKYGQPRITRAPFQTRGGAVFPGITASWANTVSDIRFEHPCRSADKFCLTYRYEPLGRVYDQLVLKRVAAEKSKI